MFTNQKLQLKIAAKKAEIAIKNKKEEITSTTMEKIDTVKSSISEKTLAKRAELEAELEALTAK